ncbi:dTDP-glucose 4,6-dehydratase [Cytobacillus eiseniae]|uniref:dTDP-glucose 4,6-dehydratase n=1 Tax=Cytobacillus eiseniae TaxID=762947 RepID=A0ABS4RHI1_9BACI|nr:dTDP-glucose 4,6-dehydratase [Cytobacillus eiseniae]MBP2242353.1 dTDP-glucose 4,6-dehydratase [Cytobacillus eiseniae]
MISNQDNIYQGSPETLLITGGAGFIGSNFIHYILKKYPNYKVINLDSLTYAGNIENLKEVEANNYQFIKGDICDSNLIENVFSSFEPTYVINFAAESHVDRSIKDPQIFLKTNISGTQILLDACKRHWGSGSHEKKFLQVSTDEVYGSLGATGYFTEETPLAPNSPYSASKASADLYVRAYHETFGLNVNITRCSNNYGPYQFPEKLIPLMISNALEDKDLPIYGDGMNIRDWLYVEDHCSAIDLVLHQGTSGEIYNVGGYNEKANIEIVKIILKEMGKPTSLIKFVKDRLGHDKRYAIDASKIKDELGWEPTIMFEEGIRKTIGWYLQNQKWLDRVKSGEYAEYYHNMYIEK